MSSARLWVPGRFLPTNELLSMMRAEGFYEGRGSMMPAKSRKPPGHSFALTEKGYREAAWAMALAEGLPRPFASRRVDAFFVLAYRRPTKPRDADAWTLAGKAILDGLADAGVVVSDGRGVRRVGGDRCGLGATIGDLPDGLSFRTEAPGMLVILTAVDDEPT